MDGSTAGLYILGMHTEQDIRLTLYGEDPARQQTEDEPALLSAAVRHLKDAGCKLGPVAMRSRATTSAQTVIREVLSGAVRDPDALASLVQQATAEGRHLRDVVAERLR